MELPDNPEFMQIFYGVSALSQTTTLGHKFIGQVFDLMGYSRAIQLQAIFNGDEVEYTQWLTFPKLEFNYRSPAEMWLDGKRSEVEQLLDNMEELACA